MERNDYTINVNNSPFKIFGHNGGYYFSGYEKPYDNGPVIIDAPCEVETFYQYNGRTMIDVCNGLKWNPSNLEDAWAALTPALRDIITLTGNSETVSQYVREFAILPTDFQNLIVKYTTNGIYLGDTLITQQDKNQDLLEYVDSDGDKEDFTNVLGITRYRKKTITCGLPSMTQYWKVRGTGIHEAAHMIDRYWEKEQGEEESPVTISNRDRSLFTFKDMQEVCIDLEGDYYETSSEAFAEGLALWGLIKWQGLKAGDRTCAGKKITQPQIDIINKYFDNDAFPHIVNNPLPFIAQEFRTITPPSEYYDDPNKFIPRRIDATSILIPSGIDNDDISVDGSKIITEDHPKYAAYAAFLETVPVAMVPKKYLFHL